jgi:hypothetical protein
MRLSEKPAPGKEATTSGIAQPDSSRQRRYWHSRALRFAIRVIPRSWRFRTALLCARMVPPLIRRTMPYRQRRKSIVDGPVEIALYIILAGLTRDGIAFDPRLRVVDFELFEAAVRRRKGVLLISGHGALGFAFLGYLAERGYQASVVSYYPDSHHLLAPKVPVPTVSPGRSYLFEVRERFRRGEVVGAMIDRAEAIEGRTVPVETHEGTLHVADALIQVAENAGAEVIFLRSWVESSAIAIELASPSQSPERNAKSIARDFAQFIQHHVSSGETR